MSRTGHKLRSEQWYGGWAPMYRADKRHNRTKLLHKREQQAERFMTLEVEELFKEAQEKAVVDEAFTLMHAERDDQSIWDDMYPYGDCPCCSYNYDYDDRDPEYYEAAFDPREKYAVEAYLAGQWNPQEEDTDDDHQHISAYCPDCDNGMCYEDDGFDDWDMKVDYEAFDDRPEPPNHERAYNRRQAALKG